MSDDRKDGSTTKVLVVEDDDDVRNYARMVLQALGYEACVAADGEGALRMLDEHGDIRLLMTDIGLPGALDGPALAAEVRRRRPGIPVLYASGSVDSEGQAARLEPGSVILPKPYRRAELAEKLRKLLAPAA